MTKNFMEETPDGATNYKVFIFSSHSYFQHESKRVERS